MHNLQNKRMKRQNDPIQVFIVDDHPMVVEGLRSLLTKQVGVEVCGHAGSAAEALEYLKISRPDVLLLDINLADMSGIDLCKIIHGKYADVKVLAISTFNDRSYISAMIESGASGYLIKNASVTEIEEAINTVMSGRIYLNVLMQQVVQPRSSEGNLPALTRREKEILGYISEGLTNTQIAGLLYISPSTVDTHRKNMLTKLGVANSAALIRLALEKGLLT